MIYYNLDLLDAEKPSGLRAYVLQLWNLQPLLECPHVNLVIGGQL